MCTSIGLHMLSSVYKKLLLWIKGINKTLQPFERVSKLKNKYLLFTEISIALVSLLNVPYTGTSQGRQYLILKNARRVLPTNQRTRFCSENKSRSVFCFPIHPVSRLKRPISVRYITTLIFHLYQTPTVIVTDST